MAAALRSTFFFDLHTAFANFSAGGRGVFKLFRRRGALNKHKRLALRAYAARKRRFDI